MTRRGMTLIEVLAATVLLAMIAAACLPTLRGARAALSAEPPGNDLVGLGDLADAVISDPSSFGIESLQQGGPWTISWPDDLSAPQVAVQRFEARNDAGGHAWISYSCDGLVVARWVPLDEEPES